MSDEVKDIEDTFALIQVQLAKLQDQIAHDNGVRQTECLMALAMARVIDEPTMGKVLAEYAKLSPMADEIWAKVLEERKKNLIDAKHE